MSINDYELEIYSQNNEDGIIREIFNRIGKGDRYFVEFGVEYGKECNTRFLTEHHCWGGLLMEGSPDKCEVAEEFYSSYPLVKVENAFITKENIVALFRKNLVPWQFDLLSVDIDGNDYWVLREILKGGYSPRVIVCEYNGYFPPDKNWVIEYDKNFIWDGTTYYGASLKSLTELVGYYGYSLVGTDTVGVNAFFVCNDELSKLDFPVLTPKEAYHEPQFKGHRNNGNKGHLPKDGPHLEI